MQERGPTRSIITGSERTFYTFTRPDSWDIFESDLAGFTLKQNALEGYVAADRGYILSTNNVPHEDVIINVTIRQTDGLLGNGFGVVCRAGEMNNGYYFLLSSDGHFTISVATPARDELFELIPWQFNSAINQGYHENEIRAVCVGDYLAMFINDVFVAETRDSEFVEGEVGLALGAVTQAASASFDDVLVRDAIDVGAR